MLLGIHINMINCECQCKKINKQYIIMNHEENIKYIKINFHNIPDDKLKSFKQSVKNNLKKQYKLKNPILHEYCLINTIEELNKFIYRKFNIYHIN